MDENKFSDAYSLLEILEHSTDKEFPSANKEKTYFNRFKEFNSVFAKYPVEMGAMKEGVDEWKKELSEQLREIETIDDETEKYNRINEILGKDSTIFLNKHGEDHINKVQERAFDIIKCFTHHQPSSYEVFLLLCSISIHDIGNILGRVNHEKNISKIMFSNCDNIIDDSIERRVIAKIAGVHGGSISGSKDTISVLKCEETYYNFRVREQLLAAVLRFADELADDNTRAIDPAMKLGIIGDASEIYHIYSSSLHTVQLEQNPVTGAWTVVLKYEFDESTAKKQYQRGAEKKYLLDEIYNRTIKMERERRYCMRFLRSYCNIDCIDVEITIDKNDSVFDDESIKYTLKECGYPDCPDDLIETINGEILSGKELAQKLSENN